MRFAAVCLVLMTAAAAAPAAAQSPDDLRALLDRLQRLERDVRTLNIQIARGSAGAGARAADDARALAEASGGDTGPAAARLEVRMAEFEKDLRAATGQMEEITFQVRELTETLQTLSNDISFRLDRIEKAAAEQKALAEQRAAQPPESPFAPAQGAGQPVGEPAAPGAAAKKPVAAAVGGGEQIITGSAPAQQTGAELIQMAAKTPEEQYKQAFGLLRQARYADAETALKGFLAANNGHRLASNARYWLGETHYVRARYLDAARAFLAAYDADQKGAKAPDSLLKLGMSLGGMQQTPEACATFGKLEREFPNPGPGIAGALAREKQRYSCR